MRELAVGVLRLDSELEASAALLMTPPSASLVMSEDVQRTVDDLISTNVQTPSSPILILVGQEGSGRRTLLRRGFVRAGLNVLSVRTADLPSEQRQREQCVRACLREAQLFDAALVLEDLDKSADTTEAQTLLRTFERAGLSAFPGPIAATMTTEQSVRIGRGATWFQLEALRESDRASLWTRELGELADPALVADVAQRYQVSGGTIAASAGRAAQSAQLEHRKVNGDDIHLAVRGHIDLRLAGMGTRVITSQTWDDIVLTEDVLAEVQEVIARVKHRRQVYESWGFARKTLKMLAELQAKAKKTQEAIAKAAEKKPEKKPRSSTGPTAQPQLPIVEQVFLLDEPDRACPSCGGELRPMKDQFEESEMIDVIEARYQLVKVKQQKYVCQCGGCVETALGPQRAVPGSRYSLAFAIKVMLDKWLDKWLDHIPLERQCRILERHGLVVTSQRLWDLAYAVAQRLSLVDAALFDYVKAQPVIGLDQTGWPRLEAEASKPWQMWCLTAPGVVVHRIRDDKSAATFKELVGDYNGTIVADALGTHEAGAREGPGITLAGCWAHVYRRFDEALADHPDAERALAWIGTLYDLDRRGERDLARIGKLRRAEAPAILRDLRAWLYERAADTHVSIGKAAAYTLGIWDRLTRFVEDARIPLDNNATERAIRGPVVGRKNHYGSKSRSGTQVAATLYTILETLKLHDVAPSAYLIAAIQAADRGQALLPWNYAAKA